MATEASSNDEGLRARGLELLHGLARFGLRLSRRVEATTLVGLLVLTVSLWAVVAVASEMVEGDTKGFDRRIVLALRNPSDLADPIGPGWLEEAVRDLTALGSDAVLLLVTLGVLGYLLLHRRFKLSLMLVVAVGGARLLSTLLKGIFARPRPDIVSHEALTYSASFPSGHAMLSAAVYLTLAALMTTAMRRREAKAYVLGMACALTFLVGVSRVYLGVHWPTDVLAGWAMGIAWAILGWLTAVVLRKRKATHPRPTDRGDLGRASVGGDRAHAERDYAR